MIESEKPYKLSLPLYKMEPHQNINVDKEFKSLEADSSFISKNLDELSRKYEKKFIAVHNEKLVVVGDNFDEVMEKIEQKGMNPPSVLIEYIPKKGEIILY